MPHSRTASVVSALESVLTGIDVLVFGVVLGACAEQLHWAITEQSQSSNAIASIVWPDVQSLYCSLQFSEADSGKAGRRASVLQALLSACLRSAESMRRSSLRYAVSEDGIYDLRIFETYTLPTALSPPGSHGRFADVGTPLMTNIGHHASFARGIVLC